MAFKKGQRVMVVKPTVGLVEGKPIPLWKKEGEVVRFKPFPPPPVAEICIDGNTFTVFAKTLKELG